MIYPKAEQPCTPDALKKVRVHRPPSAGLRWSPLPHYKLVEALIREGEARGWKMNNFQCALSNDKTNMAASMDVSGVPAPEGEMSVSLAATNSTSQRDRIWIYAGLRLMEEDVGVPLSKTSLGRHTTRLRLEDVAREGCDRLEQAAEEFPPEVALLRKQQLSADRARRYILHAGDAGLLSDSRVTRMNRRIDKGVSKWELLVRFARMSQQAPPLRQVRLIYSFLKEILGE